jgi:hypothetical protein
MFWHLDVKVLFSSHLAEWQQFFFDNSAARFGVGDFFFSTDFGIF